jgi:laccase
LQIKETKVTRLCHEKTILAVNGQFPGPTIYARKGDVVVVNVYNQGSKNITLHWHGVDQPRNPWSDGPEYITQCPIKPGANLTYRIIFTEEEGTLWWHAHSDFDRATVHGAIVVHPKRGSVYPYPRPHKEVPIILGEWWNADVEQVLLEGQRTGGDVNVSDANTINGQPGDYAPCSKNDTFRMLVEHGKTYLLRIINAGLANDMFFAVAGHRLTVVGTDGRYLKPFTVDHIMISSGQTMNILLEANHATNGSGDNSRYYMAASPFFANARLLPYDDKNTTAILEYTDAPPSTGPPDSPDLPAVDDVDAAAAYMAQLRSLVTKEHSIDVPMEVGKHMLMMISVNTLPCGANKTCNGPRGDRLAASLNNVSFVAPTVDILDAYYDSISGVYELDFPNKPPLFFNFTAPKSPQELQLTMQGTKVKVVEYGTVVEVVFQDLTGESHPMHLHGFSFYVVGRGFRNFDKDKDPATYNLVDPPYQNTVSVPPSGWAAMRFRAINPGK